jgi:hypothetical protein
VTSLLLSEGDWGIDGSGILLSFEIDKRGIRGASSGDDRIDEGMIGDTAGIILDEEITVELVVGDLGDLLDESVDGEECRCGLSTLESR